MRSDAVCALSGRSLPVALVLITLLGTGFWSPAQAASVPSPLTAVATVKADETANSTPAGPFKPFAADPTIIEEAGVPGQFDTGSIIRITPPAGFAFDPTATVTAVPGGGSNITLGSVTVTATAVSVPVVAKSTTPGTIAFSGLTVRPLTAAAATLGRKNVGVTATVFGTAYAATIAQIDVVPGTAVSLTLTADPTEAPLGTTVDLTITALDSAGNPVPNEAIALMHLDASNSVDVNGLTYFGTGVSMNVPTNGQAIIVGQTTDANGEITLQVRNTNSVEDIVDFVVADASGTLTASTPATQVRWYVQTYPPGTDALVVQAGEETLTTDTRADGPAPAFTIIDPPPIIQEGTVGQFSDPIVITPPTGWSFDTGAAFTAVATGGVQLDTPTVAADSITIPVLQTSAASGAISRIVFTGIALQPNDCVGATLGDHYVRITTGDTSPGLDNEVIATLTVVPGTAARFTIYSDPALNGVTFASTLTLTAFDACDNQVSGYDPAAAIVITSAGAVALSYAAYDGTALTTGAANATIPAHTIFDAVGQYSFRVTDANADTVTFTAAQGAIVSDPAEPATVQWVAPTCTFPDGISIWVSNDKMKVLVLGTDDPNTIVLTAAEVSEGTWVAAIDADPTATPPVAAVPGDPPAAGSFLFVNGHICPEPADPAPAGGAGIPIVDGLEVTVLSFAGNDRIEWTGLSSEATTDPATDQVIRVSVAANGGDDDDVIIPGPGPSPHHGISGGAGNDVLDYSGIVESIGDTNDDLGVIFSTPDTVTGFNGALSQFIDTAIPSAFETIIGTEKNDTIRAADGVDTTIRGGDGDDSLYGGTGNDVIQGEAGNDLVVGNDGDDNLDGGDGDDVIRGGKGNDSITCGDGNDGILQPFNPVDGGPGDDVILGLDGDDVIVGGDGVDLVDGGDGNDTLYGDDPRVVDPPIPTGDDIVLGGDGDDFIDGGRGADTLTGGAGNDTMFGQEGADLMRGGDGDDIMNGGDGDDVMYGEAGNDTMFGGAGSDMIDGGDGDDLIDAGAGNDHIQCGPGNDGTADAPISGGDGDDIIEGGAGDDYITGGTGRNLVIGNAGNDTLLSGGTYDVCDYLHDGGLGGIDMDLNAGTCRDTYGDTDNVSLGFAIYRGTSFADRMVAHVNVPVVFLGGAGVDTLIGSAQGGDILYGEGDNDVLFGDPPGADTANPDFPNDGGSDILFGGAGDDTIWGGPGADEIYGDGDLVPQNFDEDTTALTYYPDDQMIQLATQVAGGGWFQATIEPVPVQAGGAVPPVYTTDSILNIRTCLRDYSNSTTVRNAFALPASELSGGPSLAFPGVSPGGDTIYGGGGPDLIAGGGGGDTIWGGSNRLTRDLAYGGKADPQNVDSADLIYGDYVCNRPAALQYSGSWYDRYPVNPVTGTTRQLLANMQNPPWEPTPTYEMTLDTDGVTQIPLYPIPRTDPNTRYDMERPGGGDEIHGGFGNDVILGGGGGDQIMGNRGSDVIYGDYFFAQDRDDTYYLIATQGQSTSGADVIRGGEHADFIFGGPGGDTIYGGDPADPEGWDEAGLEDPHVRFEEMNMATGTRTGDVIQGNSGADLIYGQDVYGLGYRDVTNDALDRGISSGSPGIDSSPQDVVDYSMVPPAKWGGHGVDVSLGTVQPNGFTAGVATDDGEGFRDTIYGVENVIGSRHDDTIRGTNKSDDSKNASADVSSRSYNIYVADAFGRPRFPAYFNHPNNASRTLLKSEYDNILLGEDGNDILFGERGNDALCGGNGDDVIWGDGEGENGPAPTGTNPDDPKTSGNDEIWGDLGNDQLYGEWGDDVIHGGGGSDYLSGGNGNDALAFTEEEEITTGGQPTGVAVNLREEAVDLGVWTTLATTYAAYNWPLDPATSVIPGGGFPAKTVQFTKTPDGTVQMVFPGGTQLPGVSYNPASPASGRGFGSAFAGGDCDIVVNRYITSTPQVPGSVYNPDRFEYLYGSDNGDVLYGHSTGPTTLFGGGGNDILVGGAGNDTIYGEVATTTDVLPGYVIGATGSDVLEGRGGDDLLVGGPALPTPPGPQLTSPSDWVSYNSAPAGANGVGVVVNLAETEPQNTGTDGTDRLIEIQNVLGSSYKDTITGNWRPNILCGGPGDDTLIGRTDADIQQGNRTYILGDTLDGGAGVDAADYRYGNPAVVEEATAHLTFGACPATYGTATCGYVNGLLGFPDGEDGTDVLVNVENVRNPDTSLQLAPPSRKVISPGQSVQLDFYASGGDGNYKAEFTPTTDTKDRVLTDGTVLGTVEVAILAAPASQVTPVTPFVIDTDLASYKAVRTLTGSPGSDGQWRFTVFARPLATTTFRATVTDMTGTTSSQDVPAKKQTSRLVEVVVAEPLTVTIQQPEYVITSGQSTQLRATVTGGIPPYQITWTADNGTQATTLSATNILIPIANPTVTTKYTIRVQDTTPDSLSQEETATTKVTVLAAGGSASGSSVPSGSGSTGGSTSNQGTTQTGTTQTGTGTSTGSTGQGSNASGSNTPNEVTGTEEADAPTVAVPMCGFGVTSWVMLGNLLALAVMKRRRW